MGPSQPRSQGFALISKGKNSGNEVGTFLVFRLRWRISVESRAAILEWQEGPVNEYSEDDPANHVHFSSVAMF